MTHILLALAAASMMAATPTSTEQPAPSVEEPSSSIVVEEPWTNIVYKYSDTDASYTITLTSKSTYTVIAINGAMKLECSGTYTIDENNVLTLLADGKVLYVFDIQEDNTIKIHKMSTDEIDNIDYSKETFLELITQLKNELSNETINWNNVGKILIAICSVAGVSIISLLIAIIKLKCKDMNLKAAYEKVADASKQANTEALESMKKMVNDLGITVQKSVSDIEHQRQLEAEANSIKLHDTVEEAKKNLEINDVLDK